MHQEPLPAPETRNVCVISTAHLTAETVATLSGPRETWPIYGGAYGATAYGIVDGFFVHVSEECEEYPADLAACLVWATSFSPPFDYIMFDADGPHVEGLTAYEHD